MPGNFNPVKNADIIHPYSHTEANFVETWEERKARKQRNDANRAPMRRQVKPRKLKSGITVDEAFCRRAEQLYKADMSVKAIAIEMQCGENTIKRIIKELNWPTRKKHNELEQGKLCYITITMSQSMVDAVDHHIWGKIRNRSAYVRRLIQRDLGK